MSAYRSERKYLISLGDADKLVSKLDVIMNRDENGGSGYTISSMYFDDEKDSLLWDTYDGKPKRKKYRIRIYNDNAKLIKFEKKEKIYHKCKKTVVPIDQETYEKIVQGDFMISDTDNELLMKFSLEHMRPAVIVTYEREAFVCKAGNVRVTIDRGLRGSKDFSEFLETKGKNPRFLERVYDNDYAMLEVKYDEFLPDYIARTIESGNLIRTSSSKYQLCRELFS